jgi:hypothetical protein
MAASLYKELLLRLNTSQSAAGMQPRHTESTGKCRGRGKNMTAKETAIRVIQELPEDASWEDIQERINFVAGVRKGLRELDQGKGIAHERVTKGVVEF